MATTSVPDEGHQESTQTGDRRDHSRHAFVWFNTAIRTDLVISAISDDSFRFWIRLPYLADDESYLPSLEVIAEDAGRSWAQTTLTIESLIEHGLIARDDDRLHLSDYSQALYCYSQEEADAYEAAEAADGDRSLSVQHTPSQGPLRMLGGVRGLLEWRG